jgi:hypothetical protein
MTQVHGKRRGQGEDSIYWDSSKNRYVGAVSLGFSPSGRRIRRKVTGRTKADVRDKFRELHQEVDSGLRPRRSYTVNDALDDWLACGLDGVSARTVTLYRGTIAPMLREQLGAMRLRDLTGAAPRTRSRPWHPGHPRGPCRSRTTYSSGRSAMPNGTA